MKQTIACCAFVAIATCCCAQSDDPISQVTKHYFRSNPFKMRFSSFLNHLVNDPTLSSTTINKRTDTSFFFFKGDYASHNPFGFKAERTEIRLAESELNREDSLPSLDTLVLYQLLGYSYGSEGTEMVKKEFFKFNRKYGRNFYGKDAEIRKGGQVIGGVRNYFTWGAPFFPISVAWAKLDDLQNVFTITIFIKVMENTATLPIPADSR